MVWKRVKGLGALPLQQSVYILPAMPELKESLKNLRQQILDFGGECRILDTASIDGRQEDEIVEGFNALRNQEYEEILDECVAFDQEIDKETKAGKFYFAEEEEIEKRLDGLNRWFDIVAGRDFFGAETRGRVAEALSDCRVRLDAFGQEVFSREQVLAGEARGSVSSQTKGKRRSQKEDREGLRPARVGRQAERNRRRA